MTPPSGGITLVAPAICVTCTVYKAATLRPHRATPAQRCLCWLLLFCTLGIIGDTPLLYTRIDAFTGVPNLSLLITESAGMALTWPGLSLLSYRDHDAAVARAVSRRRLWWAIPVFAVLLVLWKLAGGPSDPAIAVHRAGDPLVVAQFSVQHAVMAVGAVACGRWCWQFSVGKPRELKVALRVMAFAGVLGVLWVCYRWSYYAAALAGVSTHAWGNLLDVDAIVLGTATASFGLGSTLPDWGARAQRALRSTRSVRRLRPLWFDLVTAVPEVQRPTPSRLRPTRRLHRYVVEIRDAQHVLACRVFPASDPGDCAAVELEAMAVQAAVRASLAGQRPARARTVDETTSSLELIDLREGLADEVSWLGQVASRYTALGADVSAAALREPVRAVQS